MTWRKEGNSKQLCFSRLETECFHTILAKKLRPYNFYTLQQLEQVLVLFYEKYNNERLHSSICNLPPNVFLECWNKGLIEQKEDKIKRKITLKLKIPYNQSKI